MAPKKHAPDHEAKTKDRKALRRLHLSYVGDVEDSAFRYNALENARRRGLTGWLSKAFHGITDLFIQGSSKDVEEYMEAMDNDRQTTGCLYNLADIEELSPVNDEDRFTLLGL